MRLLVTGSRNWSSEDQSFRVHEELWALRPSVLMHGAAKGADECADMWAHIPGAGAEVLAFRANWAADGRAAGPIRNARMLKEGRPDRGLAFGALWKPCEPQLRSGGVAGGKVCVFHKTRCVDYCPECKAHPPHKLTGTGDMVSRMLPWPASVMRLLAHRKDWGSPGLPVRWVASPEAPAVDLTEMPGPGGEVGGG